MIVFIVILGATMPYRVFWNRQRMRWALGADDIVFTVKRHQRFFSLGKTIPITRGGGVYQRSMDFAIQQINQGDWVHVFPEGIYILQMYTMFEIYYLAGINLTKELRRLKWGKFDIECMYYDTIKFLL
jgi:monolysocardiolipin acyltransferase